MTGVFSDAELHGRIAALRRLMAKRALDVVLVSTPENIYYLSGLSDWGFFAPVMLVVPLEGDLVVATRDNKAATVRRQVAVAGFEGHSDSETVADAVTRVVLTQGRARDRIGLEMWSSGLSHGLASRLRALLPDATWEDASGLVDGLRAVMSPAEQDYVRRAAELTDAAMAAALDVVDVGASEAEIAAECQRVITEGGTFPGFGPFVRSGDRLDAEHSTWTDRRLRRGDRVLFEVSGCVARYHAPVGRLVHVGHAPDGAHAMAAVAREAFAAARDALADGVPARDVYAAWHAVLDRAGLGRFHRHHCGYMVGIGMPPSWMGGTAVTGLRPDSDLVVRTGMAFSIHSWLMETGRGDFFLSNTVLLTDDGPEQLTRSPVAVAVG